MSSPADAIIAVTFRCNAHCVMCNVWKSRRQDALSPQHMRNLPGGLKTINFSGGEPFCRADLPEFVRQARAQCPGAQITISTNAYLPERIAEMMGRISRIDPSVRLAVSLDGIGEAHDRIRGDRGAFDSAMDLIDRMSGLGFGGLRLGMTLSRENLDQLGGVADLAASKGLELGVVAAHACRTHLGIVRPPTGSTQELSAEPFRRLITDWLRSWRPKQWLRAHFAYNTYRFLKRRRWRFRCHAAEAFFFVQADGTVYSCPVLGKPMGNLATQSWSEIRRTPAAAEAREFVRRCSESCWMICTARSVYRAKPLPVAAWILTGKLRAHLGRLRLDLPAASAAQGPEEETLRADTPH